MCLSPFCSRIVGKQNRGVKTRCGDSRGTDMSPIRADSTDFVILIFFKTNEQVQKCQKTKMPKMSHFPTFFPKPQPPGPLGPFPRARARSCGSGGGTNSSVRPNGAPVMPIWNFQFRHFVQPPQKNTFGHSGNHQAEERKSSFSLTRFT